MTLPHGEPFAEKWSEWLDYKKEIKDAYKSPKSATAKAKQLQNYSESVAIQMIEQSIANGWKGIFPLVKGIETTESQVYKQPSQPKLSDYKPEKFERSEFVQMLRIKFKAHFETGVWTTYDWNGTIHNFLTEQGILKLTEAEKILITSACIKERDRPRTRLEDPYSGVLEINIKSAEVKKVLDNAKSEGKRIDELI